MDHHIGQRLKAYRERSNIKMPAIAAITGIAKETLYKWEKGTKPSNLNEYFTLKAYLDKMENQLEEEQLEQESRKPATLRLPFSINRLAVPQTDGKAAAGTVVVLNDEPELIVDRINAPFLGLVEGAVEVIGESMAPTFYNGCRVAIVRLRSIRLLRWGACYYIVDKNWRCTVQRVYSGENENTIKLVSDNPDQIKYPPRQLPWDEIETIFEVTAAILRI